MKSLTLTVKGIQINPDGSGVVLTVPSATNPSKSGVFKYSAGGLQRLATRAGLGNPFVLKQVVALGASINMDATERKAGEAWENEKTGETGVYSKDYIDTRNEEIVFSAVAQSMITQSALASVFGGGFAPAPAAAPVAVSDEPNEGSAE
jgi:hypothetical protein